MSRFVNRLACGPTRHRLALLLAAVAAACASGKGAEKAPAAASTQQLQGMQGAAALAEGQRCDDKGDDRVVNQYDTSGDQVPDVRKVFRRTGTFPDYRLILVCREVDINQDGRKDIVRYYSDLGVPQREEADRNLDGRMDEVRLFQGSQTVQKQIDGNRDGKLDTKIFYRDGVPLRIERDTRGRSETKWQPDRWEYLEEGRIVRIGSDVDGDGSVDLWDRDEAVAAAENAAEAGGVANSPTDAGQKPAAAAPAAATPAAAAPAAAPATTGKP